MRKRLNSEGAEFDSFFPAPWAVGVAWNRETRYILLAQVSLLVERNALQHPVNRLLSVAHRHADDVQLLASSGLDHGAIVNPTHPPSTIATTK